MSDKKITPYAILEMPNGDIVEYGSGININIPKGAKIVGGILVGDSLYKDNCINIGFNPATPSGKA